MKEKGKRITKKGICPRCCGTGKARTFNRQEKYPEKIRIKAEKLFDMGLTLRNIAQKLKISHPQTIKNILSYK